MMLRKSYIGIWVMINLFGLTYACEIQHIQEHHIVDARNIIYNTVFELQIIPSTSVYEVVQNIIQTNSLSDMNDMDSIERIYIKNKGCFFVVIVDDVVVGTGAIKNLDDQVCELTRMFFSHKYRWQGLGSQLIQSLLSFADTLGYRKVQLNVWNPITQWQAIEFYKKFGFYEIDPYKVCPGKVFMEKIL